MNLLNKIIILWIFLIFVFFIFMLVLLLFGIVEVVGKEILIVYLLGVVLFIIVFIIDWIDGYYVWKYDLVMNLGKFLDLLVDKLLVLVVFVVIVDLDLIVGVGWVVIIIISCEFVIIGLRFVLVGEGEVVVVNMLGKIKIWI